MIESIEEEEIVPPSQANMEFENIEKTTNIIKQEPVKSAKPQGNLLAGLNDSESEDDGPKSRPSKYSLTNLGGSLDTKVKITSPKNQDGKGQETERDLTDLI